MKKKVSNSDRARIWNVDVYADMVKECPKDLLSEKGSFSYFGTSLPLLLAEKRRKQYNIMQGEDNTVAVENDEYFINRAKKRMPDADTNIFSSIDYEKFIKDNNNMSKWGIRNVPYNDESSNNGTPLWHRIIEADNRGYIMDWQADVLPTSLQRGSNEDIRKSYLNDYGLYKIKTIPFDAFSEYGADVETAMYFCKKGYDGNIEIVTDIETYSYDFRKEGFIVTPDTKVELEFILSCLRKDSYDFNSVKSINPLTGKSLKVNSKKSEFFSENKDSTFKYPLLCKMQKDNNVLGYTSDIIDPDWDKPRLVIPNYTGGWDSGNRHLGVAKYIEPGIQLPKNSYKYKICVEQEALMHSKYLMSMPVKYLQYVWKVQRTNDAPQLKVIPKLTDFTLETDDDILEFLGGTDIKQEIENGYARKTR